jgi:hypothetical protein
MAVKKADLFWNLPPIVNYKVGAELPVSISMVNLLNERREYMLQMRTYDRAGRKVSEDVVRVHGVTWFSIEGGDRESFDGALSVPETNVSLGVFLIDRETEEELDRVFVWLQSY